MDTNEDEVPEGRVRRRRYSDEFKASVIAQCMRPGVSIARIAPEYRLNANLLRRWVTSGERAASSGGALAVGARMRQGVDPVGQFASVMRLMYIMLTPLPKFPKADQAEEKGLLGNAAA